jgi:hypothetical protein
VFVTQWFKTAKCRNSNNLYRRKWYWNRKRFLRTNALCFTKSRSCKAIIWLRYFRICINRSYRIIWSYDGFFNFVCILVLLLCAQMMQILNVSTMKVDLFAFLLNSSCFFFMPKHRFRTVFLYSRHYNFAKLGFCFHYLFLKYGIKAIFRTSGFLSNQTYWASLANVDIPTSFYSQINKASLLFGNRFGFFHKPNVFFSRARLNWLLKNRPMPKDILQLYFGVFNTWFRMSQLFYFRILYSFVCFLVNNMWSIFLFFFFSMFFVSVNLNFFSVTSSASRIVN